MGTCENRGYIGVQGGHVSTGGYIGVQGEIGLQGSRRAYTGVYESTNTKFGGHK